MFRSTGPLARSARGGEIEGWLGLRTKGLYKGQPLFGVTGGTTTPMQTSTSG